MLVLVSVALLSAYFMASAYWRARNDAIAQLYAQEKILADQAARGISKYFTYSRLTLELLARDPEVVRNDAGGRRLLKDLYLSQASNLLSVTRVGPDGRILYTYPEEQAIGRNILDQPHVRTAFETRRPVVSQVFTSVQGFECVALHVPVLDGGKFAGTLAALIPFDVISRQFVEDIRIGRSGYAIVLSQQGVELYCPVPGHVRRSIFETSKDFPAASDMARRMLRGESGRSVYDYDQVASTATGPVRKHAYFTPVRLENTFWSICVTASEEEALLFIRGFRDRWILGMAILLLAFGVWGFFLGKALLTIHRDATRTAAQEQIRDAEREREKVLRESEERFRTYFEDSLLPMAITSPDKGWLIVNERVTAMLGYSREELKSLTWNMLMYPDDLAADERQFDRMLSGEIEGYSQEARFVRKDRAVVHTILSVRLVRRADGSPDYCLAQFQDITERRALDTERSRLEEQLRQAQKLEAVGQLAGGIAHDYNNLLTVQLGQLSLLKETATLPPEVGEALGEIEKSARMAAQLTRQLLAFSRRQVLQPRRLDLNSVIDDLLKMLRRVLREDITLELKLAAQPLWVHADAGMVEQVVMNLVVNARDAMPDGGRLTLSTESVEFTAATVPPRPEARAGKYACLSVTDTGKGMDAETRARIFEPFFTTKEVGRGTGLGLATVYGIVRQHGGWIEVDSEVDRGTVFRVFHPAAPSDTAEASPAERSAESDGLRGRGETILLVEDNPAVRQTLTASLRRRDYEVLSAADSREAVSLWQAHEDSIRLLLTDMVLGQGDNGLELAHVLRARRPGLPVVIMSGYSEELATEGLASDIEFLPKPYPPDALARAVRKRLDASRPAS